MNNLPDNYELRFYSTTKLFEECAGIRDEMSAEPSDLDPVSFARSLLLSETPEEAVTFLSRLLPARHAIWWGHEALAHAQPSPSQEEVFHLRLVEEWVRRPDSTRRQAVLDAGNLAPRKQPTVWLCLAAAWSNGSLVGEGDAPVDAPVDIAPKAINAAILMALAHVEWDKRAQFLKDFVEIALTVARKTPQPTP